MSGPRTSVLDVLVVDDQRLFADAISLAVDAMADLHCVATVGTGEDAVAFVRRRCPDVVLLDLALPGIDGIETLARLRKLCPAVRAVVLTANTTADALMAAVDAGADAFLPKEQRFTDVLEAIRGSAQSVLADDRTISRLIRYARTTSATEADTPSPELTDREHEVLILLAEGLAVKQIARRLGISVNTCRGHVRAVLTKFDTHSQLAAVVKAARAGMLPTLTAGGRRLR
jgi:DNA-binding NarL/FixJ family response regulator